MAFRAGHLRFSLPASLGALKASGAWKPNSKVRVRRESPYMALDAMLGRPASEPLPEAIRDPFGYGSATLPPTPRTTTFRTHVASPVTPAPAPEPARPTLTSIIWDADPRATVRFEGKDFSVRTNTLFADFTVKSIGQTEVVLVRGGQEIVLRLNKRGE